MTEMTWEHAAEARAALQAIVTDPDHGVAALSSAQTMSNLLKDLLPDAPREKRLLVAAAEAGLADKLREHVDQGLDPDSAIRLAASTLSISAPFTPDACAWVTSEIATAMGISEPRDATASASGPQGHDAIGGASAGAAAGSAFGYQPPEAVRSAQEYGFGQAAPGQGFAQTAGTGAAAPGQGFGQAAGTGQAASGQGFGQAAGPGQAASANQGFGQGPGSGQAAPGQAFGQRAPGQGAGNGLGQATAGPGYGQAVPGAGPGQAAPDPRFAPGFVQATPGQGPGQGGYPQAYRSAFPPPPGQGYPPAGGVAMGAGAPLYQPLPGYQAASRNGLAITSLVCGIAQFVLWVAFLVPGLIAAIMAIVFGAIALRQIGRTGQSGRGMAIAGIVCAIVGIALVTLLAIIGLTALSTDSTHT